MSAAELHRESPPPQPGSHRRRATALTVAATLAVSLIGATVLAAPTAAAVDVGEGSYAEGTPPGQPVPSECGGAPITNARAHVTADFPAGALPTNDWWTSLLWRKWDCAAVSENLMAHPLVLHAYQNGLGLSYPTTPSISGTATGVGEYHFPYAEDVRVGLAGLSVDGKVDDYSDWTVTTLWSNGADTLRTTFGHGLPFVYATRTGNADAVLSATAAPTVWSNAGAAIGFAVNGHDYAAFGPTGSTWSVNGAAIRSTLAGGSYFSVAVLPTTPSSTTADRVTALAAYRTYAHNHVTGTKVSWAYDEATSKMTSTYSFTTTAREPGTPGAVLALYPHQREMLVGTTPSAYSYVSPRGPMSVLVGATQFRTEATFNGVLPQLANTAFEAGSADSAQLASYVSQVANSDPFAGYGDDTYWTGKAMGRMSQVAQIANLTGDTASRDRLVGSLRTRLTDWFTASPGETTRSFWYNANWGTLIGYPASYGSDTELNDHHFHYGYFVVGAATVAQFDPAWAADSAYGSMVDTIIKDAANWDRGDTRFPFLRDFDIYAGHDWASGHGAFAAGNNQESSSEGMNFASGLIQWGEATGDTEIRDLGIYLYTTQAESIENYWFDTDDEAFPAAFGHSTVGMVWGDGGAYSTWFSAEPEMIQGINLLPSTAGHLYLGYNPDYITRNLAELERNNGGPATVWQDIIWEFEALADAPAALAKFRAQANSYPPEEGESRAHTFSWLANLADVGRVDRTVTANTPLHAVFIKDGVRTYEAANMGQTPRYVSFSDGVTLTVPAHSVAATTVGEPDPDPDPTEDPDPDPTEDPDPDPTEDPEPDPETIPATSTIQAEDFDGQSGVFTEPTTDTGGGLNVSGAANGDHIRFDSVDFGTTARTTFSARVASGAVGGVSGLVNVRLDSLTGPSIGSFAIANTGGWQAWRTVPANIAGTTGVHTVYVTFDSGQPADFVNVNWLTFGPATEGEVVEPEPEPDVDPSVDSWLATARIEAEAATTIVGVAIGSAADEGGGLAVGPAENGDRIGYETVDFGPVPLTTFRARVASGAGGGVSGLVTVRLDSPTAAPIGTFAIGNTGGWQTWRTVPANITPTVGRHAVYVTFDSGQPAAFVSLNWLTFD
jgi:endoglucanase Acf2